MDYIYGQLNIPHKNKQYEGKGTDFFDTKICDTFSDNKTIAVYFLLNKLIDTLEATPLKCSNRKYKEKWVRPCSQTLLVGSRVLYFRGEYPTYDYTFEQLPLRCSYYHNCSPTLLVGSIVDGVVTVTNAVATLRGGVISIQ